MTNPDETIKFDITEPGPDTIEARSSDGEIISGMTWDEFEKRIAKHRISRSIGNGTYYGHRYYGQATFKRSCDRFSEFFVSGR